MENIKEYTNGEVTVVWKATLCQHSAKCVHGLPGVFKPKDKPWIQPENSNSEAIIATVMTCPSGALSYYLNADGKPKDVQETPSETTKVEVNLDGPLMVHGAVSVVHADGRVEERKRSTAFCRCGESTNKPFCDGSHKQHIWK